MSRQYPVKHIDFAVGLIERVLKAYNVEEYNQSPRPGNKRKRTDPEISQVIDQSRAMYGKFQELRGQITTAHRNVADDSGGFCTTATSSTLPARINEDRPSVSNPWHKPPVTIADIMKESESRLRNLRPSSMHPGQPSADLEYLGEVQYIVSITTNLVLLAAGSYTIPENIPNIAGTSIKVNKCLETLRYLHGLDIRTLHRERWPYWRSERVQYLVDMVSEYCRYKIGPLTAEEQVLAHIRGISIASGVPAISRRMLESMESAHTWEQWKEVFLEVEMLQRIKHNLAQLPLLSIPWSRLERSYCRDCRYISLERMSSAFGLKTCVQTLRCVRPLHYEDVPTPDYMCTLGAFMFDNVTVTVGSKDFLHQKSPSTASGLLELGLPSSSGQHWDGLGKLLQISGFYDCDVSTINLDVAAKPSMLSHRCSGSAVTYLLTTPNTDSRAASKIPKRVLYPILTSEAIRGIEDWISACDSTHSECARWVCHDGQTKDRLPALPTRVIDLGLGTDLSSPIRLIASNGIHGKYTALSYCWGKAKIFTTTRENMHENMQEIPLNQLPATFLDAFSISRRLNIRYIWIDALCIVQNDSIDWDREARKMGAVYQSAYVTIAASSSDNAGQSFLEAQTNRRSLSFALPYDDKSPDTFSLVVGDRPDAKANIKHAELNRRGWVLQERLLSRRVLHFARDQVYWECRHHARAEDGSAFPQHLDQEFLFPLPGLMKKIDIKSLDEYTSEKDDVFQKVWTTILAFYCNCEFSQPPDRLIALSSLVNKLRPLTKRTYEDGNWFLPDSNLLPESLFWRPEDSQQSIDPTAPSWSWTSRQGTLDFAFHNRGYRSSVTLIRIQESSKSHRRSLHLRGIMFTAQIGKMVGNSGRSYDLIRPGHDERNESSYIGNVYMNDPWAAKPETVSCLLLFHDNARYPIYWALREVSSNQDTNAMPVYERIGTATRPRNVSSAEVFRDLLLI